MTYCYITEDGRAVERDFPIGKAPAVVRVDGRPAHRDYRSERLGGYEHVRVSDSGCPKQPWPRCSDAAAVSKGKITAYRDYLKKSGVPTEFTQRGQPILTSQNHQRRFCKALGYTDFGDAH